MSTLAKATAVALVAAAVILATIVLPAEYGIDPLGTGEATGLIELSRTQPPPIVASGSGPVRPQPEGYKVDTRQFTLEPFGGYVEYKYELGAGAAMLYKWSATGVVNFDFHTEPEGLPPSASDSFERGTASEGRGSYVAPYAGIHGWFWQNDEEDVVTVTVTTAGFYAVAKEFRDDGSTDDYPVQEPGAPSQSAP
ncbi:MAG: hypothetical protein O2930_08945 [Acidobacteria bacterium]|nr:hypothetical protein [Acidobacteriota bacterium]